MLLSKLIYIPMKESNDSSVWHSIVLHHIICILQFVFFYGLICTFRILSQCLFLSDILSLSFKPFCSIIVLSLFFFLSSDLLYSSVSLFLSFFFFYMVLPYLSLSCFSIWFYPIFLSSSAYSTQTI